MMKGSFEAVLNSCTRYYNAGAEDVMIPRCSQLFHQQAVAMGKSGLRGSRWPSLGL